MKHGILLHEPKDDVGVAVTDLKKGAQVGTLTLEGKSVGRIRLLDNIPLGHKIAMRALAGDQPVIKYGRPVGKTVKAIARGAHVHTHNVKTLPVDLMINPAKLKLTGFRRPDSRYGIRNHVIILPVDDISNAAAEGVAHLIRGTMALPHAYGRLQFGEDLELTFRTLAGTGRNPNIAACVVIGIEPKWTQRIVKEIAKTGKPVAGFHIERSGDLRTIERAARKAKEFVQYATELRREPFPVSKLVLSTKCGESDTTTGLASCPTVGRAFERLEKAGATLIFGETSELTGGEDIIQSRCINRKVLAGFNRMFENYTSLITSQGVDLLGSQPTEGNIRGGLTTIEEKAMGNIQKIGRCCVRSVLEPAVEPRGKGLHFMDSSSAAAEMVTLCAAAGSVVHYFPTGQGNVIGNPICPVIKLSGNPLTLQTMSEHIDVDVTGILRMEMNLDQAADSALTMLASTINGRLTAAETLRHDEFVLTKLYRSA